MDDDEEGQREKRKKLHKFRSKVLADNGLADEDIKDKFQQHPDSIQLINISNDPSLASCLIYFLKKGDNKLGSADGNAIIMKGLGVSEKHCSFKVSGDFDKVEITPTGKDSKVTVNGNQITKTTELSHLDRVVIGTSNAYKVVIPKQKVEGEEEEEGQDYEKLLQDRLNADTKEAKNMRKYIEEMKERIGDEKSQKFIHQLQKILEAIDEANEYTRARYVAFPLDRHYVYFSLEVMIDILTYDIDDPEFAIRCRHSKTNDVLFLWSMEKFYERLELMREWYADLMDDGIINRKHETDPWHNVTDDDIKRKQEEAKGAIEDRIQKLEEKLAKLRERQEEHKG